MALITPYTLNDLAKTEPVSVNWNVIQPFSPDKEEPAIMSVTTINDHGEFCMSMINCVHPDGGKFWDSMFIPTNLTGGQGMSITCWGKASTKGQFQVKEVSEQEWYKTVKSKAVSGGYDVKNFVGRTVPLSSDHGFVRTLQENPDVPSIPCLAFTPAQKADIGQRGGPEGLGYFMGKAASNIIPTENFIKALQIRNHDFIGKMESLTLNGSGVTQSHDLVQGFIRGVSEKGLPTVGSGRALAKAAEPQIDREEVYGGGWGAFG